MWSGSAQDWLDDDAHTIFEKLEAQLGPGAILLLHDNLHDVIDDDYLDRKATLEATRCLISRHGKDYTFLSVQQLLRRSKKIRRMLLFGKPNKEFLDKLHPTSTRRIT